eukprot:5466964-Ditylum_brightwellii.AAC.1
MGCASKKNLEIQRSSLGNSSFAVWHHGRMDHITSKEVVKSLRVAVVVISKDKLGFKQEEIGTHSIRSGATMA